MSVPRWHFPMLGDTARNRAYARAIEAKVKPGDVVLDIGCGAGLTAMLAARAGAKHVYTCEQQPLIAEAAAQVIADNGLSSRITVIPKWSHDIIVGVDIPEPADVVLSEIVDTVLLGEGALATLTHAMTALAKPGARAIPERGTLLAQPVESDALVNLWRPKQAEGFDLSAFHRFANAAQITPNDLTACALRALGPAAELFEFDFTRPSINPARTETELLCTAEGMLHAVFVSFEMQLAPGIQVSNGLQGGGHWGRTAFLLDRPQAALPGQMVTVTAQHDAEQLSVSVHAPEVPAEDAEAAAVWLNPVWKSRRARRDRLAAKLNPAMDLQDQAIPSRPYH
jgi:SAM-dependent methyltransferase